MIAFFCSCRASKQPFPCILQYLEIIVGGRTSPKVPPNQRVAILKRPQITARGFTLTQVRHYGGPCDPVLEHHGLPCCPEREAWGALGSLVHCSFRPAPVIGMLLQSLHIDAENETRRIRISLSTTDIVQSALHQVSFEYEEDNAIIDMRHMKLADT